MVSLTQLCWRYHSLPQASDRNKISRDIIYITWLSMDKKTLVCYQNYITIALFNRRYFTLSSIISRYDIYYDYNWVLLISNHLTQGWLDTHSYSSKWPRRPLVHPVTAGYSGRIHDWTCRGQHLSIHLFIYSQCMMTPSSGNIFRVTGHLCGEFTGDRWIPRTEASDAELWCIFCDMRRNKRLSKQSWGWWFETASHSLWRHCNALGQTSESVQSL